MSACQSQAGSTLELNLFVRCVDIGGSVSRWPLEVGNEVLSPCWPDDLL